MTGCPTNRWTGAAGSDFRIIIGPAQLLGIAVARSTPPFGRSRASNMSDGAPMDVEFRRIGDRRYAVILILSGRPTLEMNPAPGYDVRLPHDLLHFVVERELGIRYGIFGQLAAGGTAGTFRPISTSAAAGRKGTRQRRALAKRGAKLLQQGRADSVESERAADTCLRAWIAHAAGREFTARQDLPYSALKLARVCAALDEVSCAWTKLLVGQALTLHWPDTRTVPRGSVPVRPNKSLNRSGGGVSRIKRRSAMLS